MFNLFKPYVGPTVIVGAEQALSMSGIVLPPMLVGLLLGFAGVWALMALVTHRALAEKFPWLHAWFPFADPAGVFTRPEHLTAKYLSGHTFKITDLLPYGNVVQGRTFEDCTIHGPAILNVGGVGHMHECTFDAPSKDAVYILTDNKQALGIIIMRDCSFKKCRFVDIGILGGKDGKQKFDVGVSDA